MVDTQHLSPTAHQRLVDELADLTGRGRIEVAKRIEAARELGDLRENGDYHAAKEDQGMMEARIRTIEATLENCEIVEADASAGVTPGCVVELRYDGDDVTERFLLGTIEERHDDLDVLTPGSALGQALLGQNEGAVVSYQAPTGTTLNVTIVAVEA
ncbi:MAG TPA: transcription elongation factor GreA [Acidimicrobiales bacterium]|jgi:transcription elongation factor GreA